MCCFTWATVRSQQLLFVALAAGLWCFTAGCHIKSPLFPQPPPASQKDVCSTMGESIRPSSFHNPTLSANKDIVQICRSSLSAAANGLADSSGERRTSPFNGIERSPSHAVVPLPRFQQRVFVHRAGTLAKGHPLSKLFSKAEPLQFKKETRSLVAVEPPGLL